MTIYQKFFVAVIIVFVLTLALYLPFSSPQDIFNTPDENANYFFAKNFALHSSLQAFEPLEQAVNNVIRPRGINVIRGFLVPESFLGLPLLYGLILQIAPLAFPYLIFIFTIVVIFCLYKLFCTFFNAKIAGLSILFVVLLPVFLYLLGRPLMHTILFFDFLILGWWLLVRCSSRWAMVAGLLIGIALTIRTSEIIWVTVATLGLMFCSARNWGGRLTRLFYVALGGFLIIVPLLFFNQDLYGNFFGTGYSVSETNLIIGDGAVPQLAHTTFLQQVLLPFGFHPLAAFNRFAKYALGRMWWWIAPMILGAIVGIRNPRTRTSSVRGRQESGIRNRRNYFLAWIMISLYLILVYGSFAAEIFADPQHPLGATIGSPYLRYWLPIFIFGAPFVASFFVWLKNSSLFTVHCSRWLSAGVVILAISLSLRVVVWYGPESWRGIQDNLWNYAETRERAVRATPSNAVLLIPRWADRIYFPERRVIMDVQGENVLDIISTLIEKNYSVFWLRGRGEIKLEPEIYDAGFKLERRFDIDPQGKMYEIKRS